MRDQIFKAFIITLSALSLTGSTPAIGDEVNHDLTEYVLYAGGDISFRERITVTGHIGAGRNITFREDCTVNGGVYLGNDFSSRERVTFSGDILGGNNMSLSSDIKVAGSVMAPGSISIQSRAHIAGDVIAGEKLWAAQGAVIDGSQLDYTKPTDHWVQESVTFPSFKPGSKNLSLGSKTTHAIDPGNYQDLSVGASSTVKLRTGVYHFRNVSTREHFKWEFDDSNGPIVMHVSGNMSSRENTTFTPSSGSADGLILWVNGSLSFREKNKFTGQIRAKSNISFRERFEMTGTAYSSSNISLREDSKFKNASKPPVYYVRAKGSDSNDGSTPGTAFRSIQRAVNSCVAAGSTIYVGPGEYRELIEIGAGAGVAAVSGNESRPNRIIADTKGAFTKDDPGKVVINGQGSRTHAMKVTSRVDWILDGFDFVGQRDYTIQATNSGMKIRRCIFDVPRLYAIYITSLGDTEIESCTFERDSDSAHSIWVQPANTTEPVSISITRNDITLDGKKWMSSGLENGWNYRTNRLAYGIVVYGAWSNSKIANVDVSNNVVSDCYLPIYWAGTTQREYRAVIANNTVTGSFYSIYAYSYSNSNSIVINNIIESCYFGLHTYGYAGKPPVVTALIENNITFGMERYRRAYELDIIHGDPMFMDPANGDFSLKQGSPGIDAGTSRNAPATDIAGRSRPSDGDKDGVAQHDLGAYEVINTAERVRVVHWNEIGGDHNK